MPSHARRGDSCSALTSAHLRSLKSHLKKPKCLFSKRNIHSTCCGIQSLEQARHHEVVSLLAEVCNSESLFLSNVCQQFIFAWARGVGEVLPYISYIGMRRHWVGFLCRFGLKTGMHFTDFDLKSGWVFEGTTGVYEHFCRFNSK